MSIREEQCRKVCRILDDVLANRPTERDSLIVATRNAFSTLSAPCEDAVSRAWLLAEYDRQHQGPPGGARKIIETAPPVMPKQAEQPMAKWVEWLINPRMYKCSNCQCSWNKRTVTE